MQLVVAVGQKLIIYSEAGAVENTVKGTNAGKSYVCIDLLLIHF